MSNLQYTNLPSDTSREDVLVQLALDVSWTLSRHADQLWQQLNPELWERTHNPWAVLQTVSGENLKRITAAPAFRATLVRSSARDAANQLPRWFEQHHPHSPPHLRRVLQHGVHRGGYTPNPLQSKQLYPAGNSGNDVDDRGLCLESRRSARIVPPMCF